MSDEKRPSGLSRRRLLAVAGGGAVALAAGGIVVERRGDHDATAVVPFHGEHQAGITTAAQDRLMFASFDVSVDSAAELRDLLRTWTDAAARLTAGLSAATGDESPLAPPLDTGEAAGLPPASLTLTFGFSPAMFDGRFGLAARRPHALRPLGPLPGEQLDPDRTGGDLCVQACSDDPQVAFHAVRNLARIGRGAAVMRWTQLGFGRTSSTVSTQQTLRNLQGFKDGTNNLHGDDAAAMERHVWVGPEEPQAWLRGGTYLVARRIRMFIESWDRTSLAEQQRVIGRFKESGAPLTGTAEHDTADLASKRIAADAHIRLAAPATNGDQHILRRGYSFTDGIDPRTGELDAGLFFVAFQRDPHRQFAAIQRRLGTADALAEYIQHTGSGLFAVPPGAQPGGFVGEGLFKTA